MNAVSEFKLSLDNSCYETSLSEPPTCSSGTLFAGFADEKDQFVSVPHTGDHQSASLTPVREVVAPSQTLTALNNQSQEIRREAELIIEAKKRSPALDTTVQSVHSIYAGFAAVDTDSYEQAVKNHVTYKAIADLVSSVIVRDNKPKYDIGNIVKALQRELPATTADGQHRLLYLALADLSNGKKLDELNTNDLLAIRDGALAREKMIKPNIEQYEAQLAKSDPLQAFNLFLKKVPYKKPQDTAVYYTYLNHVGTGLYPAHIGENGLSTDQTGLLKRAETLVALYTLTGSSGKQLLQGHDFAAVFEALAKRYGREHNMVAETMSLLARDQTPIPNPDQNDPKKYIRLADLDPSNEQHRAVLLTYLRKPEILASLEKVAIDLYNVMHPQITSNPESSPQSAGGGTLFGALALPSLAASLAVKRHVVDLAQDPDYHLSTRRGSGIARRLSPRRAHEVAKLRVGAEAAEEAVFKQLELAQTETKQALIAQQKARAARLPYARSSPNYATLDQAYRDATDVYRKASAKANQLVSDLYNGNVSQSFYDKQKMLTNRFGFKKFTPGMSRFGKVKTSMGNPFRLARISRQGLSWAGLTMLGIWAASALIDLKAVGWGGWAEARSRSNNPIDKGSRWVIKQAEEAELGSKIGNAVAGIAEVGGEIGKGILSILTETVTEGIPYWWNLISESITPTHSSTQFAGDRSLASWYR